MIEIRMNKTGFVAEFSREVSAAKNPTAILSVSGRELAIQLKKWFLNKDRTQPNPLSSRRSHFWDAVSRSVSQPQLAGRNSVSVSITDAKFAQKLFGGRITAKLAGALTIPVEERAYGLTAGTFEHETGLKLILIKTGKGAFQKAVLAVKEGKGITVEYVLKPSVNQKPDPTALPPETLLEQAILARAKKALANQAKLK